MFAALVDGSLMDDIFSGPLRIRRRERSVFCEGYQYIIPIGDSYLVERKGSKTVPFTTYMQLDSYFLTDVTPFSCPLLVTL